jgi:hypothetical protein
MASKNLMGGSLKELKEVKDKLQDLGLSMKSMKSEGDILKALAKWKTTFGKGKMAMGGTLKNVPSGNKGIGKLPTPVRNNMGFKASGGKIKKTYAMGGGMRKANYK